MTPFIQFRLVRMLDTANRIYANPHTRLGLGLEESVIYRDSVRHDLEQLIPPVRNAVILMAEGYTMSDACQRSSTNARTVKRMVE